MENPIASEYITSALSVALITSGIKLAQPGEFSNMDDFGAPTIGNLQAGGNLEVGAKLAAKLAWPSTAKQSLLSSWGRDLVDLVDLVLFPSKTFQNMASMIPVHYSEQIWTDSTWFSTFFY